MIRTVRVFTPLVTARMRYAFDFIFTQFFGMAASYHQTNTIIDEMPGMLNIFYGRAPNPRADLNIPCLGFLEETDIYFFQPDLTHSHGQVFIFPSAQKGFDLDFDLPAAIFYLLSRYEEYLPVQLDRHGRFSAIQSFAFKNEFLQRPLINEWLIGLEKKILDLGFQLSKQSTTYHFTPTYDIDLAWAFKNRPVWRQLAGLTRDAFRWNWTAFGDRWSVLLDLQRDPYDTYDWLQEQHLKYKLDPIFFWLLADRSHWDRNISPAHPNLRNLFLKINQENACGLHPSYQSNRKTEQLQTEIDRFSNWAGKPPTRSRQHYLMLQFPRTYRQLMAHGIFHDYSMGYADQIGFRASYAGTFPWYDLEKEETTDLMITPFAVMDVTLYKYMRLNREETEVVLAELIDQCRSVRGHLVSLWHNSSFYPVYGWQDMKTVYTSFLAKASEQE